MQLTVTGRHVEVPEEVRKYAEAKGAKLPRFHDRISSVEFVLDQESDLWTAELKVKADRTHEFVAKETGPDRFALIDLIIDKVERQLTKHKEKVRDLHRPPKES